jgi:sulfoxide reductase heme-binding subunit YedZ
MKKQLFRINLLQTVIHLGVWSVLILLAWDYFSGRLSVNPILDLEQRTGRIALTLLVLSLACTPVYILFGWRQVLKSRRSLGLYSFMLAAIHLSIFLFLDYGLSWALILDAFVNKLFILVGAIAFLILLALALTSLDASKSWLGRNWKRLHELVYLAALLVVLHYAWARKGDIFHLQGDILRPFLYGLAVLALLFMRICPVRTFFQSHRPVLRGSRKKQQVS